MREKTNRKKEVEKIFYSADTHVAFNRKENLIRIEGIISTGATNRTLQA